MKVLHPQKVALVFGLFLGGWHLMWSLLVLISWAQPLLNFIFWAHMIENPFRITGFSLTQSITLVFITFAVGYVGGWFFAWLWNRMNK